MSKRLIDANALMKRICGHECGMHPEDCDGMESETVPCNFHAYVSEAPTIDAQLVKHGHWIETRRYMDADGCIVSDYSCSECGSVLRETNPDDRDSELYCYRCGAKMDGGDADA